jgi:carbamoyl-phosphate synthase small subunit
MASAYLVLDDGRIFEGSSWAATGKSFGEAVFQTGMTGYQETLTDPSYHKQIVVMTAPHIGNTGVNDFDNESEKIWVAGFVVRNPSSLTSNWRAQNDLEAELVNQGIVGIQGVDTCAIVERCVLEYFQVWIYRVKRWLLRFEKQMQWQGHFL